MKAYELERILRQNPIIAAVKDEAGLSPALQSDVEVIFVLFSDILEIAKITSQIKTAGKSAFVHVDLVEGLSRHEVAVDFIKENTQADGILSTKLSQIQRAGALGLISIQRFFLLDSLALRNVERQLAGRDGADFIEVLPGLMPKVISSLCERAAKPLIAGGLINEKNDAVAALAAGALAVSSTNESVWRL